MQAGSIPVNFEDASMSKEAVLGFMKSLDENEQLQKQLQAIPPKSRKAATIVAFAQKHGFEFTESELEHEASQHAAASGVAISEEQLANVVGGMILPFRFGANASHLLLNVHSFSNIISRFNVG
jgi:predicted ribosomally synthesized peptide with nif11-like leader